MHNFEPLPAASRAIQLARAGQRPDFDDGPVGDLERDALAEGIPLWFETKSGSVYLAANASWPGLFKIGCTRRSVAARLKQLSGAGVATPWVLYQTWAVHDAHGLEALAHRACERWLVKGELFHAPAEVLARTVERVVTDDTEKLCACLHEYLPTQGLFALYGDRKNHL